MMKILTWPFTLLMEVALWIACGIGLYHFQVPYYSVVGDQIGERCAYCGKREERPL